MRKILIALLMATIAVSLCIQVSNATTAVLFDDEGSAYWSTFSNCVGTTDYSVYYHGVNSLFINATTGSTGQVQKHFASDQNFTGYTTINFWWYGNQSNSVIRITLQDSTGSNYFYINFGDNYRGWHLYSFGIEDMVKVGSMTLDIVHYLIFSTLATGNFWHLDYIYLTSAAPGEVTISMISNDWLTFSALMALSLVCLLLAWKSNVPIINFVFGVVTLGTAAYYLGSNIVFAGWINILAILMASLCMLSGAIKLRET